LRRHRVFTCPGTRRHVGRRTSQIRRPFESGSQRAGRVGLCSCPEEKTHFVVGPLVALCIQERTHPTRGCG
jgi:hypothetical protein